MSQDQLEHVAMCVIFSTTHETRYNISNLRLASEMPLTNPLGAIGSKVI